MRVILSGGGTGGHIYPALAVAQGLKQRIPGVEILYVGTADGLESSIVPKTGLRFAEVDIKGINRSSFLRASKDLARFPLSIFQGWNIIRDFQPDIVVGTGGYVSFPVVLAATFIASCRTFIHEQNAIPGLANRRLAARVDCVMLNFDEARPYFKARSIIAPGMPVRKEILDIYHSRNKQSSEFESGMFTLLAFGGSRGAMSINNAMLDLVVRYRKESLQVIWITGENNYKEIREKLDARLDRKDMKLVLNLLPYMYNIEEALKAANLAICRAGAGTLSELALLGLPAVLIPYPYAADNHQEYNARALLDKKAVEMIIDEFLDGDTLYKKVELLRQNPALLQEMAVNMRKQAKPQALDDILDALLGP